jgi:predicted nucleic acid-binding protein
VRLVIADTGPINYLIQIGQSDLLPRMFERVALPTAVHAELANMRAPLPVRHWITSPPTWLEIHETIHDTSGLPQVLWLDEGETAAIALAEALHADLLLMDERDGVRIAREKNLRVTGTLGLLDLAAELGLVDFGQAIKKLEQTSFRRPKAILDALLRKHVRDGGNT